MNPWPHQIRGVADTLDAIAQGQRRICFTSPTGGGKTFCMGSLIDAWTNAGLRTVLYTNRKLLIEQTSRVLAARGIDHGVRAAGHSDADQFEPVQVSSLQTEDARVFKKGKWSLHQADRVLVDEAHIQKGDVARKIFQHHLAEGAAIVGLTATPIDIGDLYDHLVVAGTTSELRECGALVFCDHYGPDEPDLKGIKGIETGKDLTEKQAVKAIMRDGIFGRVLEWFNKLNPERKPTILFAPGVRESIWFAEQFTQAGISAAHIDGQDVWVNGKLERSSRRLRDEVLEGSRTNAITVVCNRFVLREGIDAPWLSHGVFATVFGSLQSYLQSGGRLLRFHPGIESVTLQDHGGNWHRHGSLNADRTWDLTLTSSMITGMREDRLREKKDKEPFLCPRCRLAMNFWKCRLCGFEVRTPKHSRPVVQSDGTLKLLTGDIYRKQPISHRPDGPAIWKKMYFRSKTEKGQRTFKAAAALFAMENNWQWPDPTWPLMPTMDRDWFRNVEDVPMERLRQ